MKLITEKDEWNTLVSNTEGTDTFYTYDFMDITKEKNDKLWLIYHENNSHHVLYPVYVRKINETYSDIFSAEHGGPIFNTNNKDFIKEFFDKFKEFCKENNIVSEFCRLNPFNEHKKEITKELNGEIIKDTVIADLTKELTIIPDRMKKIEKAKEVLEIKENKNPELFYEMYSSTMERLNASKRFIHSLEFFEKLFKQEDVKVFTAYFEEKPVASILLIHFGENVHTFLSCSYEENYNANDLLKYHALIWAKEEGYKKYNLGGGLKDNDSLYQYKSTFSNQTTPRCIYKRIFNKEVYDELVKNNPQEDSNFFPAYRIHSGS